MMKIVVITSFDRGLPCICIEALSTDGSIDICRVLYAERNSPYKFSKFWRKVRKTAKIGVSGVILGLLLRRWYRPPDTDTLKSVCNKHDVPAKRVPFLNSSVTRGILALDEPDVILSLGNGYISKSVLQFAKSAALNVHLEQLPKYPGALSVFWPLFHGESETGVSIHEMTAEIDRGRVVVMQSMPIRLNESFKETIVESLHDLYYLAPNALISAIKKIKSGEGLNAKKNKIEYPHSYTTPTLSEFIRAYRNFKSIRQNSND